MKAAPRVRGILLAGILASSPAASIASVFATEGYGIWWDETDPAARARGATSIAWDGVGATGATNPASLAYADLSFGFGAYSGEIAEPKGDAGSFRQRSDLLPQIGGVIVLPRGIRLGGLVRVQSDASAERITRIGGDEPFEARAIGRGGWNRLQLNIAGSTLDRRLSVGLGLARIQGTVKEDWRYDFESADARDVRQILEGRMRGSWAGVLGAIARPDPAIALGFAGTLGGSSRLALESRTLEGGNFASSRSARQELPAQWGVGVRGSVHRGLAAFADLVSTAWGDAAFRPGAGEPPVHPYRDTTRWGVGIEFEPAVGSRSSRTFRLGYASSESYFATIDGEGITETAVTAGLRQRIGKGRSSVDLSFEYGKRGDRAKTGVEERFARLGLGIGFASVAREY